MDYQNYEEYMRSVLGYQSVPNNIYVDTYGYSDMHTPRNNYYYDVPYMNSNMGIREEDLNDMYPEIYKIVYPMVCKICNQNQSRQMTRDLIEQMTDEIYSNVEEDDRQNSNNVRTALKNGDVRNPNAKETETRQGNFLLRDLIRILILRELLERIRRPRPPMRPPMFPNRPPIMPREYRGYDYY